jgi:predicted nuclease of predicted toxin-antitoxin system
VPGVRPAPRRARAHRAVRDRPAVVKLLLDTCVWGGARAALAAAGHDVVWAGEWPNDPGDDEILALAHAEGRVLVTLDKDFGELAVAHGRPHSGIVRLVGIAAVQQGPSCAAALAGHEEELRRGALLTVEPGRLRVREP